MPHIEIKMTSGKTKEQKIQILKTVTDVIESIIKCPKDAITVVIDDSYDLDEWSIGGKTWEEKTKEAYTNNEQTT